MKTLKSKSEAKSGKLPFPSNVTTPCENEDVAGLARELVDGARDKNNVLASGEIHYFVRDHYVDPSTGTYGIENLIKSILKSNSAVFPKGVEHSALRNVAIGAAMFTDEIIKSVRITFGQDRYPDTTIRMYLSKFAKGLGKIKLTNAEDTNRPCCKPRCKWYVVE
jgi:hypothetical protein